MQFLPSEWAQYGVDANGDGFEDPYNPADAIFAAARYLRAAGGDTNIKAAVYSYNHSQAYVESVMLRAQLLGGTPSELLGAITGLTEARFPVHAAVALQRRLPDGLRRRVGHADDARRHDDLLAGGRARDRRRRTAKSCRSATRPRSGASSRCATRTATPTSTPSSAKSRRCTRCSSRTFTARSARGSPRRAGVDQGRTGAERSGDGGRPAALAAVRGRHDLGARARRRRRPRIGPELRPPPPCPVPGAFAAQAVRAACASSRKAPTTSTCIRCCPGVQVIAGTVLGHVGAGTLGARRREPRRTSSSRSARPGWARR